jgi:hypothetical protein
MRKVILSLLLIAVGATAVFMLTRGPGGSKPKPPEPNPVKVKIDNINVYLENSDSMNGYVTGTAEFESDLLILLNNVKNSEEKNFDTTNWKNISLNYINSEIVPIDSIKYDSSINDQGIKEFLSNLDVREFRKSKKGKQDRTISDISNILEIVTKKTDSNTVSILVSDFIFSPGKGIDPREYLIRQEALIKDIFERKIKEIKDLSVLIIHNEATFNGTYFTKTNAKIKLSTDAAREVKRPYYIWVIGTSNNVESFMKSSQFQSIRGYKNNALFESFGSMKPTYSIQMMKGKTTQDKNELVKMKDKHSITEAIVNSKSEFMFNLNINYGNHASELERTISENGKRIKLDSAKIPAGKTNDTILVEYDNTKIEEGKDWNSELTIVITKALDNWISEVHTDDDEDMENNQSLHRKTFGLKNLIQGVRSAFYKTNYRNDSILKDTIYTINFPIIFKEK